MYIHTCMYVCMYVYVYIHICIAVIHDIGRHETGIAVQMFKKTSNSFLCFIHIIYI